MRKKVLAGGAPLAPAFRGFIRTTLAALLLDHADPRWSEMAAYLDQETRRLCRRYAGLRGCEQDLASEVLLGLLGSVRRKDAAEIRGLSDYDGYVATTILRCGLRKLRALGRGVQELPDSCECRDRERSERIRRDIAEIVGALASVVPLSLVQRRVLLMRVQDAGIGAISAELYEGDHARGRKRVCDILYIIRRKFRRAAGVLRALGDDVAWLFGRSSRNSPPPPPKAISAAGGRESGKRR